MAGTIVKFLKWFELTLITFLLLGFLYVWFIFLAKPKPISSAEEIKDFELLTVVLVGKPICFGLWWCRGGSKSFNPPAKGI